MTSHNASRQERKLLGNCPFTTIPVLKFVCVVVWWSHSTIQSIQLFVWAGIGQKTTAGY